MRSVLSLLLALALCTGIALAQTARVQLIHNAPDPTVDVYVNGLKALDNFAFRTATNFINLPAGLPLQVAIAPANSTSAADAIATFNLTLESGKTYAVTASGIVGNPGTPFTLIADDKALEAASDPNKVDVNVLHGSPDAPPVDVVVRTGGKIVANLAYGKFTPYLSLNPGVYYLDIKPAGSNAIVQTYRADLTGLGGQAIRVLASGLLGGSPAFGLYAVTASGAVVELPASPVARVQVIHNAIAPTVDVYANDALLIDDFEFRTATPFVFVPAEVDIDLGIAPANSTSANDAIATFTVNLENGKTYIVTASGILGDLNRPFDLNINDEAREKSDTSATVDVAVLHGSPNAPAVDVDAIFVADNVIQNLPYDGFTPYLSLPPAKYDFAIRATGDPNVVASFRADLSGLAGGAAYVFASGLLGGNPGFGLFAALPNGTVVELPLTPTTRLQVIHNSPDPTVDVYAGNTRILDDFAFRTATPFIDFPADRDITLGVALPNSTSAADAIATFDVNLEEGKTYIVTASGIVGNPATPFTLIVNDGGREAAASPGNVDIAVLHGSPNAPAVDVDALLVANNVITDLAYGEFTPYLSLPPAVYNLAVRATGNPNVVAAFRADLSGLAGGAAYVFASGLLGGNPAFGLFAALPTGDVIELPVAPLARVQVIHNAIAPTVDVYANDFLLIDDFEFRTATPFVTLPAGVDIALGVASANSTSANDAIATFNVNLEDDKTYIVAASGVLGNPATPFTLIVNDGGREAAANPSNVDIAVLHGSPNAPAVDVDAVFVANDVITDLAYGEFTPYLGLPPAKYDFAIRAAGDPNVVASFRADLSGLAGGAAYVFASGLLGGNPGFGLFAALPNGTVIELPLTPTARLQVIHNSPNPTVDVYADNARILDDFAFRKATPFINFPADRDITLGVALPNSTSAADAIATFDVNLEEGKTYIVTASGIVGNPATPFTLIVNDGGREAAASPGNVDIAVLHGSPNAPAVDVDALLVANNVITDLAYGEFTPYLSLPPAVYNLAVRATGNPNVVAAFRADLSGLAGGAAYVFASGLLGGNPAFGLFAALPTGDVIELPVAPLARVQVIHNAIAPTVDVYANDFLLIDNFDFREATPFVTLPAGVDIALGVAPANSTSANDAIATFTVNLENGKTYIVAASGVLGNPATPFTLVVNDGGREAAANTSNVDIAVLHGSPNAPAVDVDAVFVANNVITNLPYGAFTPYLSLPPAKYDFAIRATGNPNVVASFRADLSGLAGGAAYVFASGLLGGNPGFGLFAALPNGAVVELPLTPTARLQVIHNSPNPTVDVYADNARILDDFAFRKATPFINFPADRDITLGVALPNSTSANDAIAKFTVNLEKGKTYIVTASGIVGNPATPFKLIVNDGGREAAVNPGNVDIAVLHGSPNAPAVDVDATFVANNVITNLPYGAFTPYLSLPPAKYDFAIRATGNPNVVASFRADLSGLAGGAAYVFASGLLGGNPAFGLFAALPTGDVIELPLTPRARVQVIHNSPNPTVDVYAGNVLLIDNFAFRTATPFIDFPADRDVVLGVALPNSTSANDAIAKFTVNLEKGKTYIVTASGIVGNPATPFTLIVNDGGREAATNPSNVDIAVLHGSPNAPAVDVDAVFVANNVITNLPYGAFTPYLSLPPALYDFAVRPAGSPGVVASYRADLSGLAGGAAYVFASGLLGGNPGFGLFAALPNGVVVQLPLTPTARAQVIHNSPAPTVDVYAGNSLLIKNFTFRTATPFVELPAARNFKLGIAPAGSTSAADAIFTQDVNLPVGGTLAVMAQGIVGSPTRPFTLVIDPAARETASPGAVALSVLHGSPDAPSVDIVERLAGPLVTNLSYGSFTNYLEIPASDDYYLDIKPAGVNQIVGTYRAELGSFGGKALRVFASGFLGQAPGFGLFAALPDGNVVELRLSPVARVQVIHNAPAPTVDIYANGFLAFNDFEYLQATSFEYVPAAVPIQLAVAPASSTSASDAFYTKTITFENGKTYYLVANGVGANFAILVNDQAREQAVNSSKVEFAVLHGSPNAPAVDVRSVLTGSLVVSNLAFGQFTPYLALDPDLFIVDVTPAGNPAVVVGTWGADLEGAEGLAGLVMATGLLNGTPEIDLVVVLPDGSVIGLAPLTRAQVIHNSPSPTVDVYLDDTRILDDLAFRRATPFVLLPAREPFTLSVAPGNSTSVSQAIYSLPIPRLETGKDYIIMAAGVVGSSTRPFQLYINENGRRRSASPVSVDLSLFHGSPDAPAVDVQIAGGPVVFDNIAFGQFSNYISAPAANYIIQVTPANDNTTIVQSYRADISTLGGQAAVVFASGFLNGTPGFEVWVALANGTTFPLPVFVRTNELDERLVSLQLAPNPAVHETWMRFELTEPTPLRYAVRDLTGRLVYEGNLGNLPAGPFVQRIEVGNLPAGMYQLELRSENSVQTRKFIVQRP